MKPTQIAELIANIKASFVSFFSILMFVAMGVGVFSGIFWASPALQTAADKVFNEGNLHHFQVVYPYGLTDDDVAKLSALPDVDGVEAGYQAVQDFENDNGSFCMKLQTMGRNIDELMVQEGALPLKAGQIALKASNAKFLGLQVGDTITFAHDGTDDDGMKLLKTDTFTITALVESPEYIAYSGQTYGFSSSGSGSIDAIGWITNAAFDAKAFQDGFPVVNVRSAKLAAFPGSFGDDYKQASSQVEQEIADLGEELGTARFNELHTEAQKQIENGQAELDKAAAQIADGEKQLADGEQKIADGEKQIADGEAQLEDGKAKLAAGEKKYAAGLKAYKKKKAAAQKKLKAGKSTLDKAQAEYDKYAGLLKEAKAAFNTLQDKYAAAKKKVDAAESALSKAKATKAKYDKLLEKSKVTLKEYWKAVAGAYGSLDDLYDQVRAAIKALNSAIEKAAAEYPDAHISGSIPVPASIAGIPASISEKAVEAASSKIDAQVKKAEELLSKARNATIRVKGTDYSFDTAGAIVPAATKAIAQAEKELAKGKKKLDAGKKKYKKAKAAYDKAMAAANKKLASAEKQLKAARAQVAQGEADLASAKQQLADGKAQLKEKTAELKDGKKKYADGVAKLEDAKREFGLMKEYGWTVASRSYNGGAAEASIFSGITERLSFSMAALFLIVGLLVTYSAVSRIVHEQITQIGTKKALGLRSREVTMSFLAYAGIAVVLGSIVGLAVAVFLVEAIIGHALGARFIMGDYPAYFGIPLALGITLLELALVLAATWFACRGILKEQAVELLKGEKPPAAKQRFYEKWGAWERLPLFTQTIVNNCMNDKRRVFSTLVGVAGCTALVVTAITLNNDVLASYDKHYEEVYGFDAISYVENDKALGAVREALASAGATNAPVLHRRFAMQQSNGDRAALTVVVPDDEESFSALYHVNPIDGGDVDLSGDGVWVSEAFASHLGAKVGDELAVNGSDGSIVHLKIAGFERFYLTHHEAVMGKAAYEKAFGSNFKANALLVDTSASSFEEVDEAIAGVSGAQPLVDDHEVQRESFKAFSSVSSTVVLVYLMLAVLMALVVLLNLNVMFIEEKKRELIVLMINGFSVADAKRYIYRDTIALTVIGIVCGLVLGAVMGSITVATIEPTAASFFKGLDPIALAAGVGVCAVLALAMSIIALRRIPAFKLTDINKL